MTAPQKVKYYKDSDEFKTAREIVDALLEQREELETKGLGYDFIESIDHQMTTYGSISEKQCNAVGNLSKWLGDEFKDLQDDEEYDWDTNGGDR